tara:strand:- start:1310 stop:5092 length:3783 start_codon:yes stop_codon:yes gene_type:complete
MEEEWKFSYPDLPVSGARDEVISALRDHQVVVVVGATGSGKTTQLPKMALEYLQEISAGSGKVVGKRKLVGCTQPRRIAAASVAKRVAEEMEVSLGEEVGYQVRFDDVCGKNTVLKFMTDGILLAETQGDVRLGGYGVIIIDEAHERSLNIDFLLGYLKRLLLERADLRVIISSATMDAGGFSDFYGKDTPVIDVEGRTFPVETRYLESRADEDISRCVARCVDSISKEGEPGDVLVFLPGEREIRECAEVLEGRMMASTVVLPLYARMGMAEQQRVFNTIPGVRRVVMATNVAETSLTIPGIVYVVDTGVARVSRWNPSRQVQRLQVEKISKASARQRKGRCGRISDGVCYRLYGEEDFEERDEFTDPEIKRSSLAGVILRMKFLGLPEIDEFPFLDPPSSKHVAEGYRTLREIDALDEENELTGIGKTIARVPVEPRLARMLLESVRVGCYEEMLVIVSGLSVMDPRERPSDRQKEADDAHKRWDDEESDFTSLLHLWGDLNEFREMGKRGGWQRNQLRKFCKRSYLNFRRVMEWGNLHKELRQVKVSRQVIKGELGEMKGWASHEVLHKALLVGMPRQVGKYDKEARAYKGVSAREFAIFPGSGMFGQKKPEWLLAYDMVDTSRLWARRVASIDPQWLEEVVPNLCRCRYHSAKWDRKQGAVYAKEIVMFGPLMIVEDRSVHFGRIDPVATWGIFVREGLLGNGLHRTPKCLGRLESLLAKVADMEQMLRRVGGVWSDEKVLEFFEARIPKEIYTAKAFNLWETEHGDEILLEMQDVMYDDVTELQYELAGYPSVLRDGGGDAGDDGGQEYPVYYKVAHGDPDDGVTLGVHVDQLLEMSDSVPDWGVEGMLEERVFLLIRSMPKGQRVACNPAGATAKAFVSYVCDRRAFGGFGVGALLAVLAEYLSRQTGLSIDAGMFDMQKLPEELQTKVWVCDDEGNELAMGKSVAEIRKKLSRLLDARFERESGAEWEMSGMLGWECGDLPDHIEVRGKYAFPALVDEGDAVGVKVYLTEWEAEWSHRAGCVRLFLLEHADHAKYVMKNIPVSTEVRLYLPHLGQAGGVNQAELLRCAVEGVFGATLPRDEADYRKLTSDGRGELFGSLEQVGAILAEVINASREVEAYLEKNKNDKHLDEVLFDFRGQLDWLLRKDFMKQVGWSGLQQYPRYFQGIKERIKRLASLPLIKDLEKMDLVHDYLVPWENAWKNKRENGALIAAGYLLENFRLTCLAPRIVNKGAVSEKKLAEVLAGCGVVKHSS